MLRFGMLSLICSMSFGVFGFGGGPSATWVGGQIMFVVCLVFAAIGFLAGVCAKPIEMRNEQFNDKLSFGWPEKDTRCN